MGERACVETVLGAARLDDLGRTLTHEHLALDFHNFYVPPPSLLSGYFQGKIRLGNVGFIQQYPYSSAYNLDFKDEESKAAVLEDVRLYKKCGGGSIVENTSHGLKRDIPLMKNVSQETGVHIVVGTGHYVAAVQSFSTLLTPEEKLYDLIVKEMTEGCEEYPSVKAGVIGEVASSWPIHDFERSSISAAAHAQSQLSAPVTFHPGRNREAPFEIMRIYLEAGGTANKAIMSHLDRTFKTDEDLLEFVKIGCYCQHDLFGAECLRYQLDRDTEMLSDAQRIHRITLLRDEGFLDKILMSHDVHTKHRLVAFGGHGYAHILATVLPKMRSRGFLQEEIDAITINNPRNWLSGVKLT